MMEARIDNWVSEALDSGKDPNEAIKGVINSHCNEINDEMARRIVEKYNVKSVINKIANLEENITLADVSFILKKETILEDNRNVTVEELPDMYGEVVCKMAAHDEPLYFPVEHEREPGITYRYIEKKAEREPQPDYDLFPDQLSAYLTKLAYSTEQFFAELKYLYPDSPLLKSAEIAHIEPCIPDRETEQHKEFAYYHEKVAKEKEEKDPPVLFEKIPKEVRNNIYSVLDMATFPVGKFSYNDALFNVDPPIMEYPKPLSTVDDKGNRAYPNKVLNLIGKNLKEKADKAKVLKQDADTKIEELVNHIQRKRVFESIISMPEFENANHHQLLRVYRDMTDIAPNLTLIPSAVKSLMLTSNAMGTGSLDPESIKVLAETEQKLMAAKKPELSRPIFNFSGGNK